MTDERLTRLERWALAVGAPVIAAGIVAIASTLWGLHATQMRMHQQLEALVENAYLVPEAKRDLGEVRHELEKLEGRTERLERQILPRYREEGAAP